MIIIPATVVVKKGHSFNLKCHVTGSPKPTVEWKKDGSEELSSSLLLTSDNELVSTSASTSDVGSYVCIARNKHGEVDALAEVLVVGKFDN